MTWTSQWPTKDGYYWVKPKGQNEGAEILKIMGEWAYGAGSDDFYIPTDHDFEGEWYGPLDPPVGSEHDLRQPESNS